MFSCKHRIRKQKEIEIVYKTGKSIRLKNYKIYYLDNKFFYNRYSIVVSSKVSKSAVKRNLIKRAIRGFLKNSSFFSGMDVIIVVFPFLTDFNKELIKKDLALLLYKKQ